MSFIPTPINPTTDSVKPSPFIAFTQRVIPATFDQSLSYQEALYAILKYLNDMSETVNANADITDQQTAVIEQLTDYVNHYFDNLDVQEEINNKLDAMAEDGTLADIIAAYVQLQALLTYDTVSDMCSATNLTNGSFALTYGFHNKNDGGGAKYKVREITNQDTINNKTLFALTGSNNLVIEYIPQGDSVNIKQFGAKEYDSENPEDQASILQFAIDYGVTNKFKVKIDEKTYLINTPVNIETSNFDMECLGELTSSEDITILNIKGGYNNIKIHSLTHLGESASGNAVNIQGASYHNNIVINQITNFIYGVKITCSNTNGVFYNNITTNRVEATTCYYLDGNNGFINQNNINGGNLVGTNGIVTVAISNTGEYNGNLFDNCYFEHLDTCVDVNNLVRCTFRNFRLYESITGTYFIKLVNCRNNLFTSNATSDLLQNDKISDNQSDRQYANAFNCLTAQYGSVTSDKAMEYLSWGGKLEVTKNISLPETYLGWTNNEVSVSNLGNFNAYHTFYTYSSSANTILHLDNKYDYDNFYTKELYICNTYIGADKEFKVYDSQNRLILDKADFSSQITPGKWAIWKLSFVRNKLYPTLIYATH